MGSKNKRLYCKEIKNYRIVLQPSAHALADVVVTGYQTLERRKLTAAIAKVELSDAMIGANKSIDQALTGQIAGVAVTTTSGAPGARHVSVFGERLL